LSFLAGDHLNSEVPGTDLLPDLAGAAQAGTGFTVPLGPGTYSYLVQQTGAEESGYSLDFVIASAAPTLSAPGLGVLIPLLLGAGVLGVRRMHGRGLERAHTTVQEPR
jgi:hypothetical protein